MSNGADYVFPLPVWRASEIFVAHYLDATLALPTNQGHDVYDSRMFPGLTFQVKSASPHKRQIGGINGFNAQKGYLPTKSVNSAWGFTARKSSVADFYILFGIKDKMVFPFVLADGETALTQRRDKQRALLICSSRQVKTGYGKYRQAKYWDYLIKIWPDDLYSYINARTEL